MLQLLPLPAFQDNYIWILHDPDIKSALVVDPGDAEVVLSWCQQTGSHLTTILVTHHHIDHIGGVIRLKSLTGATVYAPADGPFRQFDVGLRDGDRLALSAPRVAAEVMATPGHTLDHLSYYLADEQLLFCGDTLFSAGCGRLFEGRAEQLHIALERLAALPATTRVCCAHEYTEANLRFARHILPHDPAISHRQQQVSALRQMNLPSLPSDLATERASNPFLRCHEPDVAGAIARLIGRPVRPGQEAFASLRQLKDSYRG